MIYKYIKCESVIAKIMADADMGDSKLRITDIKEWIFEAIDKIGAPMQYIQRESGVDGMPILPICDGQVPLPSDLHSLSTVAYSNNPKGPWIPMKVNNSSFREDPKMHGHEHTLHEWDPLQMTMNHEHHQPEPQVPEDKFYPDGVLMPEKINAKCQLYGINGMRYLERALGRGEAKPLMFFIKPGWIVVNRKKGFIKLSYKAIATDERGYPLIPDNTSYQEAIYWYVMMKLSFPKFLKGTLGSSKAPRAGSEIYTYLQHQWNFYRNQAYAEAMMPTESDMRGIKDEWNKLVPDYNSDEVMFKTEGLKQLNYTDYYYGY